LRRRGRSQLPGCRARGSTSAYELATSRDPLDQAPVSAARVSLFIDGDERTSVSSDATGNYPLGNYPLVEAVFGGFVGGDPSIEVRVTALDGRTFSYSTVYEDTEDPTSSERYCDDGPCPTVYLNFALAPL
jgi:hypothetical protein